MAAGRRTDSMVTGDGMSRFRPRSLSDHSVSMVDEPTPSRPAVKRI